jgi:hypothetical protein
MNIKNNNSEKSIAQITREYIERRPSIKDCISHDIINYSALSRKVMNELNIKNEEAVLAACIRYANETKSRIRETEILGVLRNSRIEMRTKIAIITARNDWLVLASLENAVRGLLTKKTAMQVIQSANAITIITDEDIVNKVVDVIGEEDTLRIRTKLAEVMLRSPENIADISGILSYISSSLSEQGINIVEAVSCYTDSIFVVEEKNIMKAYTILSKCMEG